MKTKNIVFRAIGGLNDVLCQLEYASSAAEKANCFLWIDASYDYHSGLLSPLDEIFDLSTLAGFRGHPAESGLKREDMPLSLSDIWPDVLERRISDLRSKNPWISIKEVDPTWETSVLWHETPGGGLTSAILLSRVKLQHNVLVLLSNVLGSLQEISLGLHVRQGDLRTNFIDQFRDLEKRVDSNKGGSVLVSSDNGEVLQHLQEEFPNFNFVSISSKVDGWNELSPRNQAILELLSLSTRKELFIFELESSREGTPRYSGFSRLAKFVWLILKSAREGLAAPYFSKSGIKGIGGFSSRHLNLGFTILKTVRFAPFVFGLRRSGVYGQLLDLVLEVAPNRKTRRQGSNDNTGR